MRMKKFLSVSLGVLLLSGLALAAEPYQIDRAHSSVTFSVRHMMVTNVPGRFTDFSGTVNYDAQDVTKSSVTATIKAASISTDHTNRDQHLRSADFFEVEKYPEITFVSKRIEKRGNQLVAIGDFTIKDVTKQIELPFELYTQQTAQGKLLGVSATLTINRKDYNIVYGRILDTGGLQIGNDVKIELNLELRPAPPAKN